MIVISRCEKCGGEIEFEAEDSGRESACPLCGESIRLGVDPELAEPPKTNYILAFLGAVARGVRAIVWGIGYFIGQIFGAIFSRITVVILFTLVGVGTVINGLSLRPESAIHQIYQQLQYLTGALCLGVAAIVSVIGRKD
jgi:hypothetical protein